MNIREAMVCLLAFSVFTAILIAASVLIGSPWLAGLCALCWAGVYLAFALLRKKADALLKKKAEVQNQP